MTALLTDNLPLLAGAPNGIKKLRELILELAVRGKLVPQDASDEPASELLKRIAEEKARLVAEGKIKKQKPLAESVEEERLFELPVSWRWTRLGSQVIESNAGWSPSCEPRPREGNEWGVLKVSAISWGVYQPEENKALPANLSARPEHEVAEGDFLVSRANTAELVARSVVVDTTPVHLMLSDKIVRLKLTSLCERRYVNLVNNAPLARAYYSRVAGGTSSSMKNVSREQILNLPLALPPFGEQHRIVAKVDELMALCDRLEAQQADAESAHVQLVQALLDSLTQASGATEFAASWQRLAEHFHTLFTTESSIDALKQTVLQLAVMGKLVRQDPSDEPASEFVKRIQAEKQLYLAESKTRKQKELGINLRLESPFDVPAGWEWQTIDDVLHVTGGVTLGRKLGGRKLISKPYLRVANVQRGRLEMDHIKEIEVPEDEVEKYLLQNGDLLITEGGDWDKVGRTATWCDELPECLHQNHVFRARAVVADWEPRWAEMYLNSVSAREYFAGSSKQTTNLASINMTQLRACAFPLPPLAEQHRIVAKVDQLMALCDKLKARLTQARQLNEQLATALVEQAVTDESRQNINTSDQKAARALLAAEITHQLHGQRTFGQRKLQKVIYLVEHAAKLAAIQGNYLRNVAGPHDRQLMDQVEGELHKQQWYERIERDTVGHAYRPLAKAGQHRQEYESIWSTAERATIEQVITLMRGWDTNRCEMTVTLYAAWNDFILEGQSVTDEAIVGEVMHRWNDAKLRFNRVEWLAVLAEMKRHSLLTPSGFGKRTIGGTLTLPGLE